MRIFTALIFAVTAATSPSIPSGSAAQAVSAPAATGRRWSGELITDAFRGTMSIVLGTSDSTLQVSVTAGERTSTGPGTIMMMSPDSLRFSANVGGADATFTGLFRGDSIVGTMEARRGGELLGRGRWLLARSTQVSTQAATPAAETTPGAVFDEVWSLLDSRYGNFASKGTDWRLVRAIYHDEAAASRTEAELATVISTMLSHLNDNHISLRVKDSLYRPNGPIDRSSFIADSVIARRFAGASRTANRGQWLYAWLADSIAYLRIDGFQDAALARSEIDSILHRFRGARGLIMDLRKHFGGDDRAANAVINRFAPRRTLYLTSRTRSGPGHGDFLEPREFYAEPEGSWQFTRPVMILTSRRTVSAGENFLIGMRELPHVTLIGDVTSGAFADVGHFTLANGWQLNFPYNRFLDRNGVSWEGVGLAPDLRYVARPADVAAGKDVLLDLAVKAVKAARSLKD